MLARNSLISVTCSIVPIVATIVTMPFLLGAIGLERYGALALCWLFLIYLGQVDFGLNRAVTNRVAQLVTTDVSATRTTMATGLSLALLVGCIMGLLAASSAFVFFGWFFDTEEGLRDELLRSLWLLGAATLITTLLQVTYGALAGRERFLSASVAMMIGNSSLPILTLATALLVDTSMIALMAATLVGRMIGLLVAIADLWASQLRGYPIKVRASEAKRLLKFGSWIMAAQLTAPILMSTDRLVIGSNLGATAVAAYTIPYQIVSRMQLVPQSLMNVLFPRFSVVKGAEARNSALLSATAISALFLPVIVGLILLIGPLLELWLGENLDQRSVSVGIVLLCTFLLSTVGQTVIVYLQAQNDGKFFATFQLAEIPIYFAVLIFAALDFGLLGVAFAFLVRRAVELIACVLRARFGSLLFLRTQIPAVLGIAAALVIEPLLGDIVVRFAVGCVLAGLAFVAAILAAPAELRETLIAQLKTRLKRA